MHARITPNTRQTVHTTLHTYLDLVRSKTLAHVEVGTDFLPPLDSVHHIHIAVFSQTTAQREALVLVFDVEVTSLVDVLMLSRWLGQKPARFWNHVVTARLAERHVHGRESLKLAPCTFRLVAPEVHVVKPHHVAVASRTYEWEHRHNIAADDSSQSNKASAMAMAMGTVQTERWTPHGYEFTTKWPLS